MHDSAQDNFLTKNAIVIRMYSVGTERKVVDIKPETNEDQVSNNLSLIADQPVLSIAPLILAAYALFHISRFGVRNKHYIRYNMSLGT